MRKIFIGLTSLTLLLVGCSTGSDQKTVNGNGTSATEKRTIDNFTNIEASGDFTVIYKKATTPSLTVTTDENLLPYIETISDGTTLIVHPKPGYNPQASSKTKTIIVRVYSPNVSDLSMNGSGLLSADTITGELMTTNLNGSGSVGVGYAYGTKLIGQIEGNGGIELKANTSSIECTIIGSGYLKLYGITGSLQYNVNGKGIVNKDDIIVGSGQ